MSSRDGMHRQQPKEMIEKTWNCRVHRDGAEPSPPEVAGAFTPCVDHAGVTPMHARERMTQAVLALGGENEMDLIVGMRHDAQTAPHASRAASDNRSRQAA
jgi:hypothetical protein